MNYTHLGLLATRKFVRYLLMAIAGRFLAARFDTGIVITLALVCMAATMVSTRVAQGFGFALAMRISTGLGNWAAYVPAMVLASSLFFDIRQALGPAVGGHIADLTHSFAQPFFLASRVSLLGGWLALHLRKGA
jgi:hypothetical protein